MGLLLALALAEPLPLGQAIVGQIDGGPRTYTLHIAEPGILSVAVRAKVDLDLVIDVLDQDGQPVEHGHADDDIGDDNGAEQIAASLAWAGTYQVRVSEIRKLGGGAFDLSAGFIPMPAVGRPDIPYRSPSTARVVAAGDTVQGDLDPDTKVLFHWVRVDPGHPGPLTLSTTATGGDLVIEQFTPGEYMEPSEVSDRDLEGVLANESLTLIVVAGTPVFARIRDRDGTSALTYTLTVE